MTSRYKKMFLSIRLAEVDIIMLFDSDIIEDNVCLQWLFRCFSDHLLLGNMFIHFFVLWNWMTWLVLLFFEWGKKSGIFTSKFFKEGLTFFIWLHKLYPDLFILHVQFPQENFHLSQQKGMALLPQIHREVLRCYSIGSKVSNDTLAHKQHHT